MANLAGKVALVTGASSGIGAAVALALAEAGALVAVSGRRQERLEKLAAQITAAGGRALAIRSDVAKAADAAEAVETAARHGGRLDIIINSAGVNEAGGTQSLPLDLWRRVIDINLMGAIYTCKAALPHLLAAGGGDIINISSTAGRRSNAPFAAYATSKFGLTGYTESLRQEVGTRNIRVSILEPGATATEIADSITDPAARAAIHAHVSKEGAMAPEDIADGIIFALNLPRRAHACHIQIRPTMDVNPM